ncbi:MAG: MFS transporter [Alcaligenaceae bacterium]|nr:MFS transporter [Alcaligenaceae bacterium]
MQQQEVKPSSAHQPQRNTPRRHRAMGSAGIPKPQRYWAVTAILLAIAVSVMDASIANLALPTISKELNIPPHLTVWVVNAYLVTLIATTIPLSALGERIGFVAMFRSGITIFMCGSIVCALSTNLPMLLTGRVINGLGGAVMMSIFGAMMRHIYPPKEIANGISINAMIVGTTAVLSPALGAFILSIASWQWIFVFAIPLCLISLIFSRFLPQVPPITSPYDYKSAILNIITLGTFITGCDLVVSNTPLGLALLAIAAVAGTILWQHSSSQEAPLFPVDLFRIPTFKYAVIVSALCFGAAGCAMLSLPFLYENHIGLSTQTVGMLFMAWPIGSTLMARPAALLSGKYPASVLAAIGSCVIFSALLILLLLPKDSWLGFYALCMFFSGLGFGFIQTPNNKTILLSTPLHRSGATGATQSSARVFGQSVGAACVAICFHLSTSHGVYYAITLGIIAIAISALINLVRFFRGKDIEII